MIEKTDREGLVTAYTYTADGRPESILYGDGRRAGLEYSPLGQLVKVKDWLGETRIERDSYGMPVSITDHNGRTVHYEWGSMGQRQGMTYPDGTRVSWTYDGLLRPTQMKRTAEGRETLWTDYQYDQQGRLSEKRSSGGYDTRWRYNETGLLEELCHADACGILDRFRYTYDAMGNRTMVTKERRGLPEESGVYRYIYDGLQRLTGVEKDGKPLRSYQYDAFGNRTELEDHASGTRNTYGYDALNRLLEQEIRQGENTVIHKTYTYDKRGNLTGEYQDGGLLHGYVYDSMNRLQRAWGSQGEEAEYFYNALGQRTGRSTGGGMEEYLLDLTKPYHNLLELHRGERRQTFYWDMNVSAMEDENRIIQYYLSDELGSPLRILYRNGNGDAYGYDEFGVDLCDPEEEQYGGKRYSRQGERQPFGYTGYRHDDISGTYFAQAREYQPEAGRFVAEDIVRGRNTIPKTLNRYGYCWGNPIGYIDANGKFPETQDEMWQGFLEYYFGGLKEVFDNKWDSFKEDIQEKYEEIKKEAYNIKNDIMDGIDKGVEKAKDICADIVIGVRDVLSKNTGTTTYDFSVSGNALIGISQSIMISTDWKGNIAIQQSYAMLGNNDTVQIGFLNVSACVGVTYTNAEEVKNLLEYGVDAGFGIGSVGIDLIGLDWESDEINGFKISVGGGAGIDIHLAKTYTEEIYTFNVYDSILKLLGRSEYGNREIYDDGCLSVD